MKKDCIFCDLKDKEIIAKNQYCYAIFDKFPVSKGHTLIIPFRHVETFFDASKEEKIAIVELIDEIKEILDRRYSPDGYNIGVNVGKAAGQTIMHLHVHVIPRYKGDIEDPTGGVRGVIPDKMKY